MKHSLRLKTTLLLSASLFALILLCWLINSAFLENYYQRDKVRSLSESFDEVDLAFSYQSEDTDSGSRTDSFTISDNMVNVIERIEASNNVNIYILSEISSIYGRSYLAYVYPIEMEVNDRSDADILKFDRYKRITGALQRYIFGIGMNSPEDIPEVLATVENKYDVYKFRDKEVDSYYIDLVGYVDESHMIFIRASYENILESATISSRFLAIVGVIIIILGSACMFFFSRSFTKPILELAEISDDMASLNFERHYEGRRHDEIGQLGCSINTLSARLENTITELKSANIELEKDIAHKTEIDEMRKEFLSNVSHELKTPIALIQGYAEGLQENINDDPESRAFYCDVIIDEAQKMNGMVKKLLSLNEIEFGSNKLNLERFDIVDLTRQVSSSIEILGRQKNITIVFNEHEPIFVWADESMMEEVVTNYLSNAINHVSDANVIDVSFSIKDELVRVSVFNTGENIPDDELNNIWVKFYKVDKARTREYGGSGIGLSIVKAIMDQHNQKYGVINHSTGVEFWFELDIKANE